MKVITVIVKPTNACNLRCKYCYADSGKGEIMDTETLENMITKFQNEYEDIKYLWHGGEPLLAGKEFYKEALKLEKKKKKPNQTITNSIQTNGILLDDFIDSFKKNGFSVGLSIDGPKEIHDLNRIYPDGSGSFDDVMKSVNLMKEKGLNVGAVCVLNKENIKSIDDIYDFFIKEDIGFKVNPIISDGRAKNSDLSITPKEYGLALIHLFDRWFYEEKIYSFSTLKDFVEMTLFHEPITCTFTECQKGFISVDEKGDVYPCGRFVGDKEFLYGNINEDSMEDILKSPCYLDILGRA